MARQELLRFARLPLQVARQHLAPYGSKFSPKKFTQPPSLARLLVKRYLRLFRTSGMLFFHSLPCKIRGRSGISLLFSPCFHLLS
jgi:hypothetical protein